MARFYISILEGDSPTTAVPVVASEDPHLVRAVTQALLERLGSLAEVCPSSSFLRDGRLHLLDKDPPE